MEYAVGENIVHPAHGAGEIVAMEDEEFIEGYKRYCVIFFPERKLKIRIPLRRIEDVGLRSIMSSSTYSKIIDMMAKEPQSLPQDFKERREMLQEIVNSGYPVKVGEVIRELTWRGRNKRLNRSDAELLSEARNRLVREMALATGKKMNDINLVVDTALNAGIEVKMQQQELAEQ